MGRYKESGQAPEDMATSRPRLLPKAMSGFMVLLEPESVAHGLMLSPCVVCGWWSMMLPGTILMDIVSGKNELNGLHCPPETTVTSKPMLLHGPFQGPWSYPSLDLC